MTLSTQIPKKADSVNIFILIQELLSKQKENNKKHGKILVLSMVERQNIQYQKHLDEWAQKSEELKEARALEFEKLKDTLNFSKAGWFAAGAIFGSIVIGALVGALIAGPGGALAGAKLGAKWGLGVGVASTAAGISIDASISNKTFFDEETEYDILKATKRDNELERITRESKFIQDKANVKQSEISRTMQIDMETIQQLETAVSNMIVKFLELLGRTANMMR